VAIQNEVPNLSSDQAFYEDSNAPSTLKQLFNLHQHEPFFAKLLLGSRFEEVAELALNEKVIGKNVEYFNKPPLIGKPTPPHQDNYYFMLQPPQAITMWLGLEDVDTENGCVRYIPQSHLQGLRAHGRTQTLGFSQGISDYDEKDKAKEVYFSTKPGICSSPFMTIHRADGNSSSVRGRKALGFIYFGESAQDLERKNFTSKLQEERLMAGK
jgi:phytanoyl-CoA hydroxylase